ncbi:phage tail sheath subtilisin-like domain-containing protein [Streptomyces sp. NBC_01381]|uniref:phage tail sheath subtilisin-like domain-containing protein n=1 Tax=Streptomyces sp. NBC_01381 TaxID=2903845 RepID=UPI0022547EE3|nr:phage tail sheath subtilisin-like domain-containing protein [Streptomyces sp. NBC_01381]MCX4673192.1 phage tail sheath subtilisin-like domain-containing protein [Streptomyces sp. NBC_01381]
MPASAPQPPLPAGPSLPGLTATALAAADPVQPLRTDVACFAGRTRRGPLAAPVRVTDWAAYTAVFGGLDSALDLPYAIRGFFANGGSALWVLRTEPAGPTSAAAAWPAGAPSPFAPEAGCRIAAASPGGWADGTRVTVRHRPAGGAGAGHPQVLARIDAPGESPESFGWLRAPELPDAVAALSRLVRLLPDGPAPADRSGAAHAGTHTATLTGGTPAPGSPDDSGTLADAYTKAVRAMAELPEPALLALPDLDRSGVGEGHRDQLADLLVEECAAALDRLALLDPPFTGTWVSDPAAATLRTTVWMDALRQRHDTAGLQACAVHWPPLRVPDPLAATPSALRTVPASGHVAGTAARLDRERGVFATPANAALEDVVDLAHVLRPEQEAAVYASGANLLRCPAGRGPLVWGGRTAVPQLRAGGVGDGWFIAHRRLVHRLVRAARAVAEPLLFEPDSPGLRLLLVQGLTEVLLGLFEAGALAGERPAEAFRVRCDEGLNPPELMALGQLICQVEVAPAAPMEFIAVRLLMGRRDRLEVVEG